MSQLANYIVKITCLGEQGSGFIYLPENNTDFAYIFTARHCIAGKKGNDGVVKTDIQIHFFTPKQKKYKVKKNDHLLLGANNQNEDIAVLIISKKALPDSIDKSSNLTLFKLSGSEKKCLVRGIGKVVNNKHQRTLHKCEFISDDTDYPNQFQIEVSDPVTEEYNADSLVEGFSGSGVFVKMQNQNYVCGIVQAYEKPNKRFLCINFTVINELFKQNDIPELLLIEIETNPKVLSDLKKLRENSTRILNRIKSQIGTVRLNRQERAEQLRKAIISNALIVVSGGAGIGKSALTKKVILEVSEDYEVIALKGEDINKTNISDVFRIRGSIEDRLNSKALKSRKIILIDSVEKVLETSNAETVIDLFTLLKSRNDIKLVLTCRSYAVEQFKIRFLLEFPKFYPFEVPILSENELAEIGEKYSKLHPLFQKDSLKRILQIPFNLDKAIKVQKEALENDVVTEADFRRIMWQYVIENKEKESDPQIRKKRGIIFSEIALERAKRMVPYVKINDPDEKVIQGLASDNIIDIDPNLNNRYAPAHDIFEDWALVRFIEDKYQDWISESSEVLAFFRVLGTEPSIRRSFRIWISEKIQVIDYNVEKLLNNSLENQDLENYWKDEILIAIMQSSYSQQFLLNNKEFLYSHDFNILKRCLLLLKVACQKPDFSTISQFSVENKSQIYQSHLIIPFGKGWENVINYIYENLSQLESLFPLIISVILEWEKGLNNIKPLPKEARNVGLIILRYLEICKNNYRDRINRTDNASYVEKCIPLLFRLTEVVQNEVKTLIETALSKKESNANRREISIYKKVLEYTLSWLYSREVCRIIPELVIKVAEKEWFYFEPTQEEIDRRDINRLIKSLPRQKEKEEEFGITSHHKYQYLPASAFQTPISHLLAFSPIETLQFIVKLFNHSLAAFLKSSFLQESSSEFDSDERVEFEISLDDGTIIKQHGSLALWCMYRGSYVATPYLLQSVLMALEALLLQLAALVDGDTGQKHPRYQKLLDFAFEYILKESKSVACTSVLVSVATAYPQVFEDKILPLLKVKKFYQWDFLRSRHELSLRVEVDLIGGNHFIQQERYKSKQLPHRNEHLENLVFKLSLGKLEDKILSMLDNFYAEDPQDNSWKLVLNRMDKRKWQITEKTKQGFVVQPRVDEELKPIVEKSQKEIEEHTLLLQAANWARKKFDHKKVENDAFGEWEKHYQIARSVEHNKERPINEPCTLAAVGIRDYFNELSEAQYNWCIQYILKVIEYQIERSHDLYDFVDNSQYNVNPEPALQTLAELVHKCKGENQQKAKELLFACLIFIQNEYFKAGLINKVREYLWENEPDFALACSAGLLEYSKIVLLKRKINNFHPRTPEEENQNQQWIEEYTNTLSEIATGVINQNIQLNINDVSLDSHHIRILIDTLCLIPHNTRNESLQHFVALILNLILDNLNKDDSYDNEKIPYQISQIIEVYFALFMLMQENDKALSIFKNMIDWVYEGPYIDHSHRNNKFDFVENCLKQIISKVNKHHKLISNFWVLWEYLLVKIKNSETHNLAGIFLLSSDRLNSDERFWKPLEGKKKFVEEGISIINSIEPTLRLLSGIGFTELMPDGIEWVTTILRNKDQRIEGKNNVFHAEKLVQRVFYDKKLRTIIKSNSSLRGSFVYILDELINQSSSVAFLIRDDFISLKH